MREGQAVRRFPLHSNVRRRIKRYEAVERRGRILGACHHTLVSVGYDPQELRSITQLTRTLPAIVQCMLEHALSTYFPGSRNGRISEKQRHSTLPIQEFRGPIATNEAL